MAAIGYAAEIDAGRRFLEAIRPSQTVVLLFRGDADGCCAGALIYRALRQMGNELVFPVFMGKGENIYSETVTQRILAHNPSYLIVLDSGSRTQAIVPGLTTMVIDHHRPEGVPPVDLFVTSYGVEPPATASLLAYQICKDLAPLGGLEWLAAVGTAADLGVEANLDLLDSARQQYGTKVLRDTATLINSARRSASHDVAEAFEALIEAESPMDIAEHILPEATVLESYRQEVNAELKRVLHQHPRISGHWALVQFRSSDLVHPLVVVAWTERLKDSTVIAANYGYTEGNVHFSVRSNRAIDLLAELGRFRATSKTTEAHGQAKSTGGILPLAEFQALLKALGFSDEMAKAVP